MANASSDRHRALKHQSVPEVRGIGQNTKDTNFVLGRLLPEEYHGLAPHMEGFEMRRMDRFEVVGESLKFVYFPDCGVISESRLTGGTTYAGTHSFGREGFGGVGAYFGNMVCNVCLKVEVAGVCHRVPATLFRRSVEEIPSLRGFLGRIVLSFVEQLSQDLICASRHSVAARCARWLLSTHDRVDSDTFGITHDALAQVLNVRRAGVTVSTVHLRERGAIDYTHGRVTILDRSALEASACECYRITKGLWLSALDRHTLKSSAE